MNIPWYLLLKFDMIEEEKVFDLERKRGVRLRIRGKCGKLSEVLGFYIVKMMDWETRQLQKWYRTWLVGWLCDSVDAVGFEVVFRF